MAGTQGACSQVFCHPIGCTQERAWTDTPFPESSEPHPSRRTRRSSRTPYRSSGTLTGLLPDDVHVQASTEQVPPPREEFRPQPRAAKLVLPSVGVLLLLRLRQHWLVLLGNHGHDISSPGHPRKLVGPSRTSTSVQRASTSTCRQTHPPRTGQNELPAWMGSTRGSSDPECGPNFALFLVGEKC